MNSDSQFDADVDAFFDVPLAVDDRTQRIAAQLPKRFSDVLGNNDRLETIELGRTRRRRFPLGWLLAAAAPVIVAAAGYFVIQQLQKPAEEEPFIVQPAPEPPEEIRPIRPISPTPDEPAPDPAMVQSPRPQPQPKPIPTPMMATVPDDFFEEPWDEERISPDEPLPWSFSPIPQKIPLPRANDAKWSRTPIDQFVLAKYEVKGVRPVADAGPEVLLRRVTYDLTGLPPTPKEVEEFLEQVSINGQRQAITSVIEDLLGRPQFGEKWARFWLDVGGYDAGVKNAWRYREYVIAAFNNDKPFNNFVAEQLAGDLLPGRNPEHRQESHIATAFLAMGPVNPNEPDIDQFLMDQADRQVDLVTRTFLGLSVACARCHNHKFDPISKYDYYALAGIFRSTETLNGYRHELESEEKPEFLALNSKDAVQKSFGMLEERERQTEYNRLDKLVRNAESRFARAKEDGDGQRVGRLAMNLRDLRVKRNRVAATTPSKIRRGKFETIGVVDSKNPRDIELQIRGNVHKLGDVVERGFPDRLQLQNAPNEIPAGVSGRVELAKWLLSDDQPLTARVFVNRVWAQLMGTGIVSTVDDFGVNATDPSHPQMLDYLARDFMDNGWSMKRLIREIMISRVYQLDAVPSPRNLALDPNNQLYWRRNIRQLTGEEIRDSLIFTAGVLTTESAAAQSSKRYFAAGEFGALSTFDDDEAEFPLSSAFRTIYLPISENNPGMLAKFDCPEPGQRTPQRMATTNATQAMFMMNNEFVYQAAVEAAFPLAENDRDWPEEARIDQMFLSVLGREPSAEELQWAQDFKTHFDPVRDVTDVGPANVAQLQLGELADAMNDRRFNFGGTHGPWTMLYHALYETAEFRFLR